jgi:hypothetical protein
MRHLINGPGDGPGKKKRTVAKLESTKKSETITLINRTAGSETKPKPKTNFKPKPKVVPAKEEVRTLRTLVPRSAAIESDVPTPNAPALMRPKPEPELRIDQKKVRRLITSRDGGGYMAKRGQSVSNKVQRTGDKIKRFVSPTMGGADYYMVRGGQSKRIGEKDYKRLKKAGIKTYQ